MVLKSIAERDENKHTAKECQTGKHKVVNFTPRVTRFGKLQRENCALDIARLGSLLEVKVQTHSVLN